MHYLGIDIVKAMRKQPGGQKPNGFISDRKRHIEIEALTILRSRKDFERHGIFELLRENIASKPFYVEDINGRDYSLLSSLPQMIQELPAYCSQYINES